jgi:energy-converting hydrogenase Eha subunit A
MVENSNKIFSPNKTSAKLFIDFARSQILWDKASENPESLKRYLLIYDLYIKARSYAIINKIFFWIAIISSIMVLVWPSIAIITKDIGIEKNFLNSAVVQTTITGLAALTFSIYNHYKKRQVFTENLMRSAVFSDEKLNDLKDRVIKEMERIDAGFSFAEVVTSKTSKND